MSEKRGVPLPISTAPSAKSSAFRSRFLLPLLFSLLAYNALTTLPSALSGVRSVAQVGYDGISDLIDDLRYGSGDFDWDSFSGDVKCPEQPKPIHAPMVWNMTREDKTRSADLYSQAVQIPTQSFDDNGEPNEDPRWKPFFDFQKWLKTTFPLASQTAKVEYINTLGIVATFEGSDPSLKPLLLMSHYDVVPAPESTFDRWTHGAFSGYNDGKMIWGRGAADDKTLLVAQWEAITHLLEQGFKPRRTLILSHGNDEEEVFARRGQGHIAPFLEERYGKDGLLMVIDEGSGTMDDFYGAVFAVPAMGEKGYMDISITVGTDGGHSSVPPEHTGIGIMSQIVSGLEDDPFEIKLTPESPFLTSLVCAAKYAPDFPKSYAKLLRRPSQWPKLARLLSAESRATRALIGTTTAVDIVHGGVKVNALPELVNAAVNFRIDFSESVHSTQEHVRKILQKVAKKNGLAFTAFEGKKVGELGGRYVKVEMMGLPLEPAPRTPSTGQVWDLFAGTVKGAIPGPKGEERIVTPYASTGNTDCKMYYNLTKNIYRFMGGPFGLSAGVHTVNERGSIDAHYTILGFVLAMIQNADAYDGPQ